jgi:predicted kinase
MNGGIPFRFQPKIDLLELRPTNTRKLEEVFNPEELELIEAQSKKALLTPVVKMSDKEIRTLANNYYGQGAKNKDRILHIVMGPPGSGKSSTFVDPLLEKEGALLVDVDHLKTAVPRFNNGEGSEAVHKVSSQATAEVLKRAFSEGDNIVLPKLGDDLNKMQALIEKAKSYGYTVNLHMADLPPEKSARRVFERNKAPNDAGITQFVPPHFALEAGNQPYNTFLQLKNNPDVNGYTIYNMDVPRGEKPILLESQNITI